jgi:hypothetical protein
MFPLSADKLSFLEIADHWSGESRALKGELLAMLEAAWWQGEIIGNSAKTRLQFLENMYRSRHEPHLQSVVFVTPSDPGPPAVTPLPNGEVVVRPGISVPSETDDWTEDSCKDAFDELARLPSQQYFPILRYDIWFFELTREEFFRWIQFRGFDVPTFWKTTEPLSAREIVRKQEHKPAAKVSLREVEAAYKQRIKTYCGKEHPSRTDDEQWTKKNFNLTRTKARDLRRKLAPPEWRKPGRRKRKDKINLA